MEISRRQFVAGTSAATVVLAVEGTPSVQAARRLLPRVLGTKVADVRLMRGQDQLDLRVEVYGGSVAGGTITADANTRVVLTFGPQHVAERHFSPAVNVNTVANVGHAAAGQSLVVVALGNGASVPFTFDGLLDVTESSGIVGGTSVSNEATALELPQGLLLSTDGVTLLRAARSARTFGNVAEVWAARLEPQSGGSVALRALAVTQSSDAFNRLPTALNRQQILSSMSESLLAAPRLWLTSHGAVADLRGDWSSSTPLLRYRHSIQTGRDIHVETATAGYLLPFGHRAAIVTISERQFTAATNAVAAMRQRRYLMILDDVVRADRTGAPNDGLHLPFASVRATVDETDPITVTAIDDGSPIPGASTVARVAGGNFVVQYRATDMNGDAVTFSLPATFVDEAEAFDVAPGGSMERLRTWFNAAGAARRARRTGQLRGQLVAYAEPVSGPGSTSKQTFDMEFLVEAQSGNGSALEGDLSPAAFPALGRATISDAAVSARGTFEVEYHPLYTTHDNGPSNPELVYLKLSNPNDPQIAQFGADSPVRGIAAMDLVTEVFNQTSGVGLDPDVHTGGWNPAEALGAASKIIGGITLQDILDVFEDVPVPGVDIPGLTVEVDGNTIITTYSFAPKLKQNTDVGFLTTPDTRAEITTTTVVSIDGSTDPEQTFEACIYDFTLRFFPDEQIVDVHFAKACALMSTSSGLTVDSKVTGVTLSGLLGYLADLFGDTGFGDPQLEVDDTGLDLGVSLRIPDVELGVMVVKGIKIGFGLFIPFGDLPGQLSIDVGTKADPITLGVMSFGGTFYAGFVLNFGPNRANGDDVIQVGISVFWEIIKIDVIVAKATVTLRLAADFKLVGTEVTFTGRVSIEGVISLCGFVEISLVADLELTYRSADETLELTGSLTWDVDTPLGGPHGTVVLGTTTIEIGNGTSARSLRAGSSDTSFGSLYTDDTWAEYCAAFA